MTSAPGGRDAGWDWRGIAAVVRRDLRVVRGSKPVILPMIILPVLLLLVLPVVIVVLARWGAADMNLADFDAILSILPGDLSGRVTEDPVAVIIEVSLVHLLSPMLLIVPLMVASVIAADAIAGERERKTLEGLLLTPLTDRELFVAKLLGAWVPAVVTSVLGGVLYAVVGDVAAGAAVEGLLFPNAVWAALVLWVGPAIAAVSLGVTVLVSARVKTVQEAFQIAGVVVLPVVMLIVGQASGLVLVSPALLLAVGAVCWLIVAVVLRAGARALSRDRLGARL